MNIICKKHIKRTLHYHRKGVATNLIKKSFLYFKNRTARTCYSLEVDKTNIAAIGLYKKVGFVFDNNYFDTEQYGMIKKM